MAPEVLFHDAERLVAALHPILERVPLQLPAALDRSQPEARGAQVGLEAVLLEEHPLHRLGAVDAVLRRERRAAGDVPQDGVGLGELAARRDFEQRYMAARVLGEELG